MEKKKNSPMNEMIKALEIQNQMPDSIRGFYRHSNLMNQLNQQANLYASLNIPKIPLSVFENAKLMSNTLPHIATPIMHINNSLSDMFSQYQNQLNLISQQFSNIQYSLPKISAIYNSIQPQILSFFENNFSSIENAIKRAEEWRALNSLLVENYWIILDNELLDILQEKQATNEDENKIESIIIDYYLKDNCAKLKTQFEEYEHLEAVNKRKTIISSCFLILDKVPLDTAMTVVIPTLLAQITGLYEGISTLIPKEEKNRIEKALKEESIKKLYCPATNSCKKANGCTFEKPSGQKLKKDMVKAYMKSIVPSVYYDAFVSVVEKTFLNGEKVKKDVQSTNNVYRHPILHGDNTEYVSINKLIRCFLELIFLLQLYDILSSNKLESAAWLEK